MRRDRRRLIFEAVCPGCNYLNLARLVEAIHPPSDTQAEYDCGSCGKRNFTVIRSVMDGFFGFTGWAATPRWHRSPIARATVHDPGRLRRSLEAAP